MLGCASTIVVGYVVDFGGLKMWFLTLVIGLLQSLWGGESVGSLLDALLALLVSLFPVP